MINALSNSPKEDLVKVGSAEHSLYKLNEYLLLHNQPRAATDNIGCSPSSESVCNHGGKGSRATATYDFSGRGHVCTYFGSSSIASTLCFRLRRSENTPSSHFFIDVIVLPNASNRKAKARTAHELMAGCRTIVSHQHLCPRCGKVHSTEHKRHPPRLEEESVRALVKA